MDVNVSTPAAPAVAAATAPATQTTHPAPPPGPPMVTKVHLRKDGDRIAAAMAKAAELAASEGKPAEGKQAETAAVKPEATGAEKPAETTAEQTVDKPAETQTATQGPSAAQQLLEDVRRLAMQRKAKPKAEAPAPKVEAKTETQPASQPTAQDRAVAHSIMKQAEQLGVSPDALMRHYIDELKTGEAAEFANPLAPALSEVEKLRAENAALKSEIGKVASTVDERFTELQKREQQARVNQQIMGAAQFLSAPDAKKRWPWIAASDQTDMAQQLSALADVAAQHPEKRHLTPTQLADMLEADVKARQSRYASLYGQSSQSPQKSPQSPEQSSQSKPAPAASAATTLPSKITPTGQTAAKRRSSEERIAAAIAKARETA